MLIEIKKPNPQQEYDTAERCSILELANDDDDTAVSIAQARVKPECTTALHRLKQIDERYIILKGSGRAYIGDQSPVGAAFEVQTHEWARRRRWAS